MLARIADEILNFMPAHKDFFQVRMKEYVIDDSIGVNPDVTMISQFAKKIEASGGTEIQAIQNKGMTSKRYLITESESEIINFSRQGDAISKIKYKNDYTEIEITINERFRPWYITLCEYEYLLTGTWFVYYLSKRNGMMLHSSAIKYGDIGLLFSGNPGAGKSTHVSLWEKYFGDEIVVVNDDKPVIKFEDDKAYVYGTPWSGKTDKNSNTKVELGKIFFIVQDAGNSVKEMVKRDAVFNLFSQVQKPYHDSALINHNLSLIDKIVKEHGVYELKCNISREAVEKVREIL